jgi:hypothetical protein
VKALRAALFLGLAASAPATAAGAAELGFVHVEANVAGASGGHGALQIGADAFHFEVHTDGTFRLRREPWAFFVHRYSVLQNRPLHWIRVELPDADRERVRVAAVRTHLEQQRALARRESERRNVALVEAWLGASDGFELPVAGFFDPARSEDDAGRELRSRIDAARGPDFLAGRSEAIAAVLEASGAPRDLEQLRERLAEREALRALRGAWGLAAGSLRAPRRTPGLAPDERAALARRTEEFAAAVLGLLDSPRPDRGNALLLAMARHHAGRRALAEDRLLLLDAMPNVPPHLGSRAARLRHGELAALAEHLDDVIRIQRGRALSGQPGPSEWALLESLVSRGEEYALGAEYALPVREPEGRLLPTLARRVALPPAPLGTSELASLRVAAEAAAQAADRAVLERWPYDLFEHNCVTELVHLVGGAVGDEAAFVAALGGELDPDAGLVFIPHVWRDRIREKLAVVAYQRIPSYRERALGELRRAEPTARVYLRESNTLTATTYGWRDRDTRFLFFTDDVFWPRPLYGALNLGWALADATLGIATAPFDRGRRVLRGAWGALYSMPELVFQNVRKGSFDAGTLPPGVIGGPLRYEPDEDLAVSPGTGQPAL